MPEVRNRNPHPLTKQTASDRRRNEKLMPLANDLVKLRKRAGLPFRNPGTLICQHGTRFGLERQIYELTGERP